MLIDADHRESPPPEGTLPEEATDSRVRRIGYRPAMFTGGVWMGFAETLAMQGLDGALGELEPVLARRQDGKSRAH